MDIKEYRYVVEIAEQKGISRAAQNLYISQASLSGYLKNLEARLGFRIFEQVDGKLKPTSEGEVYLEHARQIVGIDKSLMETLKKIQQNRAGVVRIGMPVTRVTYILPEILVACREAYPDIEIKIVEGISKNLEELAHCREVDFILANRPFRKYQLDYQVLREEQTVLAVPETFEICKKARIREGSRYPWIDVKDMEYVPITVLKSGQRLREALDSLFLSANIEPQIFLETQNAATAYALTEKGMSACLIYDSFVELAKLEKRIPIFSIGDTPICRQFVVAYPYGAQLSAPAKAILDVIRQCLKR